MRLPEFEYFEQAYLDEAIDLLEKYGNDCTVIAGGTELVVALKQRLQNPKYLISLDKIPSLKNITDKGDSISIGPLCTLEEIIKSKLIEEKLPALKKAAWEVGSPLLRSVATIGGNICLNTRCRFYNQSLFWRSSREACFKAGGGVCHVAKKESRCNSAFAADLPPVLISYGTKIKLRGAKGTRVLPLESFYTGDGRFPNELLKGSREILTEIEIPLPQGNYAGSYHKFRLRGSIDFPLVGAAVQLKINDEKFCEEARIILTGVGPAPVEVGQACAKLAGQKLSADLISTVAETAVSEIRPFKTTLVSPRYHQKMARVVMAEALREAGGFK